MVNEKSIKLDLDRVTARFYDSFTTDGLSKINNLFDCFISQGVIVKNSGELPEIYNLAQFIEPRKKLIEDKILTNFKEFEVAERTTIIGNIAQRLSFYQKQGELNGEGFEGRGVKMILFILTDIGWKISSLSWDDEREGLLLKPIECY